MNFLLILDCHFASDLEKQVSCASQHLGPPSMHVDVMDQYKKEIGRPQDMGFGHRTE